MVLQNNAANTIDRLRKQRRSLVENENEKNTLISIRKGNLKFLVNIMRTWRFSDSTYRNQNVQLGNLHNEFIWIDCRTDGELRVVKIQTLLRAIKGSCGEVCFSRP